MGPADLLHPALHALADVTLAVDPHGLRVLDVNRARDAFGHTRDELRAMTLDALLDLPREEIARFVLAADGRPLDAGVRWKGGAVAHASAGASTSAGAASLPCVLVTIRESPEHARALEEIDRIRGVLSGALDALERLSEGRRAVAPPASSAAEPTTEVPARLPDLSLAQYVSLCVEAELSPGRAQEIHARYGVPADAAAAALHRSWHEKIAADAALQAEQRELHARYRTWFQAQEQARGAGAAPVEPQASVRELRATMPSTGARPASLPFVPAAPAEAPGDVRSTIAVSTRPFGEALPFKPADVPDLDVEHYAALSIELEAYPERRAETLGRYGIHSEATWNACEGLWAARLIGDMSLRQRWIKLCAEAKRQRGLP